MWNACNDRNNLQRCIILLRFFLRLLQPNRFLTQTIQLVRANGKFQRFFYHFLITRKKYFFTNPNYTTNMHTANIIATWRGFIVDIECATVLSDFCSNSILFWTAFSSLNKSNKTCGICGICKEIKRIMYYIINARITNYN